LSSPESRDFALLLIRKAEQDEMVLAKLLEDPEVADESLGFHLQQAVEKRLKAVLAQHEIEFERSHSISYLTTLLEEEGVELPPCREPIELLTPWASAARYEGFFDGVLDRASVEGLCATMIQWSSRLLGKTDFLTATASILQSFAANAPLDHVALLVEREQEAFVIHVTVDGSVWAGPVEELGVEILIQALDFREVEDFSIAEPEEAMTLAEGLGWIAASTLEAMKAKKVLLMVRSETDFSFSWWYADSERAVTADQPPNSLSRVLLDLDEIATDPLGVGEFEKPDPDVRLSGGVIHTMTEDEVELMKFQEELFRKKFGRDPGPGDPVFFDPEADEPRPLSQEQIDRAVALAEEFGAADYGKQAAREKIRSGMVTSIEEAEGPAPFGEINPAPLILVLVEASTLDGDLEDRCLYAAVHAWAEGHLAAPEHPEPSETETPLHVPAYPDPQDEDDSLGVIVATALQRFGEGPEVAAIGIAAALAWEAGWKQGQECNGCAIAGAGTPFAKAMRNGRMGMGFQPLLERPGVRAED
jgi:HEPN domain-containing protein